MTFIIITYIYRSNALLHLISKSLSETKFFCILVNCFFCGLINVLVMKFGLKTRTSLRPTFLHRPTLTMFPFWTFLKFCIKTHTGLRTTFLYSPTLIYFSLRSINYILFYASNDNFSDSLSLHVNIFFIDNVIVSFGSKR